MGLKDIFGKKNDQKNDLKAMNLGDSKKPQNNSVKEPKNNTLDVQTNDFLHDKEHEKFLETLSTSLSSKTEIKEDTKSEWIDLATENNQSGGLSFDESFEVKKEVSFLEKNNEKQFDNLKNDVLNKEENNFGDIMGTNNKDDLNDLNSDSLDSNTKWEDSKKDDFDLTMDDVTVSSSKRSRRCTAVKS